MYFITPKDSETGKKFSAISEKRKQCYQAQKELAQKYGFTQWRSGHWVLFGKISACIFPETPDTKIWKRVNSRDEWMPKLTTKEGKEIKKDFDSLPQVSNEELNACVGYDEDWSTIGFAQNKTFFGFIGFEDWDVKVPEDCEEVTVSKYREMFGNDKKEK